MLNLVLYLYLPWLLGVLIAYFSYKNNHEDPWQFTSIGLSYLCRVSFPFSLAPRPLKLNADWGCGVSARGRLHPLSVENPQKNTKLYGQIPLKDRGLSSTPVLLFQKFSKKLLDFLP